MRLYCSFRFAYSAYLAFLVLVVYWLSSCWSCSFRSYSFSSYNCCSFYYSLAVIVSAALVDIVALADVMALALVDIIALVVTADTIAQIVT